MPRPSVLLMLSVLASPAYAQVQVRLSQPHRIGYSELHEALRDGTPAADSVRHILHSNDTADLWRRFRSAIDGAGTWNDALLAATRLAELRDGGIADSARALRQYLSGAGSFPFEHNPGLKAEDLAPSLQAIIVERERGVAGDASVLADILARVQTKRYDHGDAWVLGRLGADAADSVRARFLAADSEEFRVRYLTLLSYCTDTTSIPLLARIYAAPDSFGIPKRYAIRASDALLWVGTRGAVQALLDARTAARARGVYADSSLWRGGYDFLANDSSAVLSRTGRWLVEWLLRLD